MISDTEGSFVVQRLVEIAQAAKQHIDSIAEARDDPGMCVCVCECVCVCVCVCVFCVCVCVLCVCVCISVYMLSAYGIPFVTHHSSIQRCRRLPMDSHWSTFYPGFIAIVVIVTWTLLQL